jgi:hypothetical protein
MNTVVQGGLSLPIFVAYGTLILLYLIILRLMLNFIQGMGDKHSYQRSVVDRDIHAAKGEEAEASMRTFDSYKLAVVIAKAGAMVIAMAAVIVLLAVKFGILATALLIAIAVTALYAIDHWLKSREKPESFRSEVRKYVQGVGNTGTILILSIILVVLLFVMLWLY